MKRIKILGLLTACLLLVFAVQSHASGFTYGGVGNCVERGTSCRATCYDASGNVYGCAVCDQPTNPCSGCIRVTSPFFC